MKISKLALIALLGGALMAFGCSDDSSSGGTGGGTGGDGGTAGDGGGGSGGEGPIVECVPQAGATCETGDIDPTCLLYTSDAADDWLVVVLSGGGG